MGVQLSASKMDDKSESLNSYHACKSDLVALFPIGKQGVEESLCIWFTLLIVVFVH